jgi:hypothetical protein
MPITTLGHVSITPVRVVTKATLAQLHQAADDQPYRAPVPSEGWGNVFVGDEIVGKSLKGRPVSGKTELVGADDLHPEQFRARLFWDQVDPKAISMIGEMGDPDLVNVLQATDITLSETSEKGILLALLGLRQDTMIKAHVIPCLRRLLLSVDENAAIYRDSSPIDFGDDDFFHWLLYRYNNDPQVALDIVLTSVRAIRSEDVYYRGASINQGADLDRPELLALIGAASTRFGPAKLTLEDATLGLTLDFELRLDGGFSAFVGSSAYEIDLGRAEMGLRLVQDVAYKVIPDLKHAYDADSFWRDTNRDAFLAQSRQQLVQYLLPDGCPHCGQPVV